MPKEKPKVNIGQVIRSYRGQRGLSQGDIERRTGLLRCYLSRVENGHTVPSLETLAKIAEAMEISLADFFPGTETTRDRDTQKMLVNFRKTKSVFYPRSSDTAPVSPTVTNAWCGHDSKNGQPHSASPRKAVARRAF